MPPPPSRPPPHPTPPLLPFFFLLSLFSLFGICSRLVDVIRGTCCWLCPGLWHRFEENMQSYNLLGPTSSGGLSYGAASQVTVFCLEIQNPDSVSVTVIVSDKEIAFVVHVPGKSRDRLNASFFQFILPTFPPPLLPPPPQPHSLTLPPHHDSYPPALPITLPQTLHALTVVNVFRERGKVCFSAVTKEELVFFAVTVRIIAVVLTCILTRR